MYGPRKMKPARCRAGFFQWIRQADQQGANLYSDWLKAISAAALSVMIISLLQHPEARSAGS